MLKNFTIKELACKCCGLCRMNDEALIAIQALRNILCRKYKKDVRIIVNSAFRCAKHNSDPKVGGATNSPHIYGMAFDITSPDIPLESLFADIIYSKLFSTIIKYSKSRFIHCDIMERPNYEIKSWIENK